MKGDSFARVPSAASRPGGTVKAVSDCCLNTVRSEVGVLVFPETEHDPARVVKGSVIRPVAGDVACEFCLPELRVCPRMS